MLAKLQQAFLGEAVKYKVLPLDDRRQELFNPKLAGRPDLMFGRKSLTLYEGMNGLLENDFINVKNTSFEIVAEVESGDKPANGVIVAQGGRFGGWALHVKDGVPMYTYNYLGLHAFGGRRQLQTAQRQVDREDGLCLRRGRETRRRRHGDTVRERQVRRVDEDSEDGVLGLLGGRDGRCRHRHGNDRVRRVRPGEQQVHRQDRQGDDHLEVIRSRRARPGHRAGSSFHVHGRAHTKREGVRNTRNFKASASSLYGEETGLVHLLHHYQKTGIDR